MGDPTRREAITVIAAGTAVAAATGCASDASSGAKTMTSTYADAVLAVTELGRPWHTSDPFLFCMHHDDAYPAGNERFGPAVSLAGRDLGQDFGGKDGWSMYHGEVVPGFPQHPHRGFETVTVVRKGLLDHSDSLGAAARYGQGDVQWLTAGRGILHAEMFPLLAREGPNPLELFQVWLNLPAADKMVAPHFSMLWEASIPRVRERDALGRVTEITVVAGRLGDHRAPPPPPSSWAARAHSDVAIWAITMSPGAQWTLPAASKGASRSLYFFGGEGLRVAGREIPSGRRIQLRSDVAVALEGGKGPVEILMLQGQPIGEPVSHYGPFVMNTPAEIRQAFADYQRTQFGGWPWPGHDPVHGRDEGRFARHADGKTERPV